MKFSQHLLACLFAAFLTATTILCPVAAWAQGSTQQRADRFYQNGEWASASAMLGLLIDEQPKVPRNYARGIVAAEMRSDSLLAMSLMEKSFQNHVPFDSVFSNVRSESFALGQSNLYRDFLFQTSNHFPWLMRTINGYLLDYYTFRNNGSQMIEYSKKMLAGLPGSVPFMTTLAKGYLIQGDTEKAIETYRNILGIDPENNIALLYLANYCLDMASQNQSQTEFIVRARTYFEKASQVCPSPYIDARLSEINAILKTSKPKH